MPRPDLLWDLNAAGRAIGADLASRRKKEVAIVCWFGSDLSENNNEGKRNGRRVLEPL